MNKYNGLSAAIKAARLSFLASVKTGDCAPSDVLELESLIPAWKAGSYVLNDVRTHAGQVWRCCQAHDSAANPGWEPGAVPALWSAYHSADPARPKPYLAPTGAQDAYQAGEYILWTDGKVYRCKQNATVHDPATLAGAWEEAV